MPSVVDLPRGTVRDFVELLFRLYRDAGRPALHKISNTISGLDNCRGTASTETIRRMLHGTTVPPHWDTVEAVALGLCELAGHDLYARWVYEDSNASLIEHLRDRWHRALDEPEVIYRRERDPWDDGPPF